jgi:hypothetical protein
MKKSIKYILLLLFYISASYQQSVGQSIIVSSITLTQTVLNGYFWPVTIMGGNAESQLVITLGEDVTLTNYANYFIVKRNNVTFEGNNKTITLIGVSEYLGLINNGTSSENGFNNLTIQNLGVLSDNSTISHGGWIGQRYFSKDASNNLINNCYSTGIIKNYGGGILGANSTSTATNCYSTGTIGSFAGGIFGGFTSNSTATNCYSSGTIGSSAGGIFGRLTTTSTASNCYSSGVIGQTGGGIFSMSTSNSTATNCYSSGVIGTAAGGLFGFFTINSTATNCYSIGSIGNSGGGIYGRQSSGVTATNCYSSGVIGTAAGGLFGELSTTSTATNCYLANNVWVSNDANSNLTGTDGTVWNTSFTPYRLSIFTQLKWGLSTNGQKTQDNTIQLNINGKIGTTSPVNENGKVN